MDDERFPAVIETSLAGDEPIVVEVMVGGKAKNLLAQPPPCPHLAFNQQVVVANLVDEAGEHVAWRVQVKVRCAECGIPFRFKERPDEYEPHEGDGSGRPDAAMSDDRLTLGAIVEAIPEDERTPNDTNWPTIGAPNPSGVHPIPTSPLGLITGS